VGLALVLYNIQWVDSHEDAERNAVPGVLSDIGVALMLFAFLFWFEKRIERRIIGTIRVLTAKDLSTVYEDDGSSELMPGDFSSDDGPMATGVAILESVVARDYDPVWVLSDENYRRCRAQAWIFNNVQQLELPDAPSREWDDKASHLISGPHSEDDLWRSFAVSELRQLQEVFAGYEKRIWGWSQRRRICGPQHEVLLLMPLPKSAPHGFVATGPTAIEKSVRLLIHRQDAPRKAGEPIYRFAGLGDAAPLPGWPPTFWNIYDPVALASHAGAAAPGNDQ
jgi:hypothetical protein